MQPLPAKTTMAGPLLSGQAFPSFSTRAWEEEVLLQQSLLIKTTLPPVVLFVWLYLFGDTEPIVRMFPYTKGSRNRV